MLKCNPSRPRPFPTWRRGNVLSLVIKARQGMPDKHTEERAWLLVTILEAVGRRMVHETLEDLDQETLIAMTVAACANFLGEDRAPEKR